MVFSKYILKFLINGFSDCSIGLIQRTKNKRTILFNFHEAKKKVLSFSRQKDSKSFLLFFFSNFLFMSKLQKGSNNIHNYAYNFLPTTNWWYKTFTHKQPQWPQNDNDVAYGQQWFIMPEMFAIKLNGGETDLSL